ncbi:MAG: hypothetical protein JNL94_05600 [Planctomycetes bacterium]|nr:hypothetical protein [Planctomycetota bacterium]
MASEIVVPKNRQVELFHLAWLAVALGIVVQLVLLALKASPITREWAAELAGKISWSVLVCSALAVARALSGAAQSAMGLAGLLGAPIAATAAKVVQKSTASALGLADTSALVPLVFVGTRAVEYLVLGILLARLARRPDAGLFHYARTGLVVGAVFGAILAWTKTDLTTTIVLSLVVNELMFPVGCSLALYAAEKLATRSEKATVAAV